jgi:hypothetical protein
MVTAQQGRAIRMFALLPSVLITAILFVAIAHG